MLSAYEMCVFERTGLNMLIRKIFDIVMCDAQHQSIIWLGPALELALRSFAGSYGGAHCKKAHTTTKKLDSWYYG